MRIFGADFRTLFFITLFGLAWQAQPAKAQCAGFANQPLFIKASPATKCARYYAPYALQAAAAYIAVRDFEGTLRNFQTSDNPFLRGGEPSLDGADVERAIQPYGADVVGAARKYLRAWQYQFGNESYLTCYDTSDADCMKSYNDGGLQPYSQGPAFHVWARTHVVPTTGDQFVRVDHAACSEVSIAFRGTVGLNGADWGANLEPVTQFINSARGFVSRRNYETDDYYHQLRRNIDAILKRISKLDCYRRAKNPPQIVTVGHSLGGGLAQFAALAVKKGPRIAKVITFDSSPVVAGGLIDKDVRDDNAAGLEIDRFYQSGEILSGYVNPVLARLQYAGVYSDCGPLIRYVKFDAVQGSSPIDLHSAAGLASSIVTASYNDQTQFDYKHPKPTRCQTRYVAPESDNDTTPVPIDPRLETVYLPSGSTLANAARQPKAGKWANQKYPHYANWMRSGDRSAAESSRLRKIRRVRVAHM